MKEEETCSALFSMRLTQDLRNQIFAEAAKAGMKPSAWVKEAVSYALENMGSCGRRLDASSLASLIECSPSVQSALCSAMRTEQLKGILLSYLKEPDTERMIRRIAETLPLPEREDRISANGIGNGSLDLKLSWDSFCFGEQDSGDCLDFFLLEENGKALYFWNGSEHPDLLPVLQVHTDAVIRRGHLSILQGGIRITARIADLVTAVIREACRKMTGESPGPKTEIRDKFCRTMFILTGDTESLPAVVEIFWISEKLRNGCYKTHEEFLQAVVRDEDETLHPVIKCRTNV